MTQDALQWVAIAVLFVGLIGVITVCSLAFNAIADHFEKGNK